MSNKRSIVLGAVLFLFAVLLLVAGIDQPYRGDERFDFDTFFGIYNLISHGDWHSPAWLNVDWLYHPPLFKYFYICWGLLTGVDFSSPPDYNNAYVLLLFRFGSILLAAATVVVFLSFAKKILPVSWAVLASVVLAMDSMSLVVGRAVSAYPLFMLLTWITLFSFLTPVSTARLSRSLREGVLCGFLLLVSSYGYAFVVVRMLDLLFASGVDVKKRALYLVLLVVVSMAVATALWPAAWNPDYSHVKANILFGSYMGLDEASSLRGVVSLAGSHFIMEFSHLSNALVNAPQMVFHWHVLYEWQWLGRLLFFLPIPVKLGLAALLIAAVVGIVMRGIRFVRALRGERAVQSGLTAVGGASRTETRALQLLVLFVLVMAALFMTNHFHEWGDHSLVIFSQPLILIAFIGFRQITPKQRYAFLALLGATALQMAFQIKSPWYVYHPDGKPEVMWKPVKYFKRPYLNLSAFGNKTLVDDSDGAKLVGPIYQFDYVGMPDEEKRWEAVQPAKQWHKALEAMGLYAKYISAKIFQKGESEDTSAVINVTRFIQGPGLFSLGDIKLGGPDANSISSTHDGANLFLARFEAGDGNVGYVRIFRKGGELVREDVPVHIDNFNPAVVSIHVLPSEVNFKTDDLALKRIGGSFRPESHELVPVDVDVSGLQTKETLLSQTETMVQWAIPLRLGQRYHEGRIAGVEYAIACTAKKLRIYQKVGLYLGALKGGAWAWYNETASIANGTTTIRLPVPSVMNQVERVVFLVERSPVNSDKESVLQVKLEKLRFYMRAPSQNLRRYTFGWEKAD